MLPATFAVVVRYKRGPNPADHIDVIIGTAFVVGPHRLATNAHVADAVLDNPWPVEGALAVQSGTGQFVVLTGAVLHPEYTGDPLGSPDVAVFTTRSTLVSALTLASTIDLVDLAVGDALLLTGFPGDVQELFNISPGVTVAQATSLTGTISALRSFSPNVMVTPDTTDVVQHQLSTTPGTSGSPLVRCGHVAGVHNAGTLRLVLVVDEEGQVTLDRQGAASNNFGIHVKYLNDLVSRLETGELTGNPLPPPDPSYAGTYDCEAFSRVTDLFTHDLTFTISDCGSITGTSFWLNATLGLSGSVDRYGRIVMTDDGLDFGFVGADYVGYVSKQTGLVEGLYFEGVDRMGYWSGSVR